MRATHNNTQFCKCTQSSTVCGDKFNSADDTDGIHEEIHAQDSVSNLSK